MGKEKPFTVLTVSDMGVATGFARVMETIVKNFPEDWDIHSLAINYRGDPYESRSKLYPAMLGGDPYGFGRLESLVEALEPDRIFILQDSWIIKTYLEILKDHLDKVVLYVPVDAGPYMSNWLVDFPKVKQVCVYTEFGKSVLQDANPDITNVTIIPHGVSRETFYPLDRDETRGMFKSIEPEHFVFLNVNRNQPRKRIDIALKAFGIFSRGKHDVKYYHHGGVKDAGVDVVQMAKRCGITDKLILTSKNLSPQNYVSDDVLNKIYNIGDIGINSCYVPGTKVLTSAGYKSIENICVGDTVFSHTGEQSRVEDTFKFEAESLLEIKPYGAFPFKVTPNHRLFADIRPYTKLMRSYKDELRDNPELRFVKAEDLFVGSVLSYPVIKLEKTTLSDDLAFIYGAYLAEGSTSKSGIRFSLNSGPKDDFLRNEILRCMKEQYKLDGHIFNYTRNRQTIEFYSVELKHSFERMFNTGARNKAIPEELLFINRDAKISLLKGHFLGDGHISHKAGTISFCTTSEELGWGLWFMLTTLGNIAPVIEQKSRGEFVIKTFGQSFIHLAKIFDISTHRKASQYRDKLWADDNYIYYPIREINSISYSGNVHDLQVSGEHSYVTHVAGHNSSGEGWGLCLAPDTEILTSTGFKRIQNINIGDRVFDKDGKLTTVTELYSREIDTEIQRVKVSGHCDPLLITKEHPVFANGNFVEAGNLVVGDKLYRPTIQGQSSFSSINLTHYSRFRYIDNYIYFETYRKNFGSKIIKKELDPVRRLLNTYIPANKIRKINKYIKINEDLVTIMSYLLSRRPMSTKRFNNEPEVAKALYNMFGYRKNEYEVYLNLDKNLIQALSNITKSQIIYLNMPQQLLRKLLDDFIERRGYTHPVNKRLVVAARALWKQRIIRLILDRLGIARSEFKIKGDGTVYFSLDKSYLYKFQTGTVIRNSRNRAEDISGFEYEVLSNESISYKGTVYNFETENHTYTANEFVVHNCNVEHGMTGHAQIVGNHSANKEIYADNRGLLVPVNHYDTSMELMTEGAVVSPESLANSMEYAYTHREEMILMGEKLREYLLLPQFDWKNISRKFAEILE